MIQVFPIFYVLMSGKTARLYDQVFEFIEKEQLFIISQNAHFMLDFETGLRKAIAKRYPKATVNGCWYHYEASLRRKFRSLHMLRIIADDDDANKLYRKLLSLPLLPAEYIETGYELIKIEANKKALNKCFKRFFSYFEGFWLEMVTFNH